MNARPRFSSSPAPRVDLEPDVRKIQAAIAFLIKEGERRGLTITQYDIVKSLFIADRAHLNKFGRLITFDNYVAMKHGPVPSLAYDLLKLNGIAQRRYGITSLPWRRREAPEKGPGCFRYYGATTPEEDSTLSPSDLVELESALTIVTSRTFREVRKLTHQDPAYKEAWAGVDENSSNPMSLGLMFNSPSFDTANELAFISRQSAAGKTDDDEFDIPPVSDLPAEDWRDN